MSDASDPQTRPAHEQDASVPDPQVGVQATPAPADLVAASMDASQDAAVSDMPTAQDPGSHEEARERTEWDDAAPNEA